MAESVARRCVPPRWGEPIPAANSPGGCRAGTSRNLNTNRAYGGVPRWKVENVPGPSPWTLPFSGSLQPMFPVLSHSFYVKAIS